MLKFKITAYTKDVIIWDVKHILKFNPTVEDYLKDIEKLAIERYKTKPWIEEICYVWIYSNDVTVGYIQTKRGKREDYYFNGNKDMLNAIVSRCECIANSSDYLYRMWLKDTEATADYSLVRPIIPPMIYNIVKPRGKKK